MRSFMSMQPTRRRAALALAALLACAGNAQAQQAEVTFTAVFRPSTLNPSHNVFENTTPTNGFCPRCDRNIRVGIDAQFQNLVQGEGGRDGVFFKIPSSDRTVTVTHDDGTDSAAVVFRATDLAATVSARGVTHGFAGGSSWLYPPAPCRGSSYTSGTSNSVAFHWRVPADAASCSRAPTSQDWPLINLTRFSIGYVLTTPNPLAMKDGIYRGSVEMSVGPGGDFDFGDRAVTTATSLMLHFELTVKHDFKVTFPGTRPQVTLAPVGGWQQWTDYGKPPARLQQDLPFQLTSSSEFSIKLDCEHDSAGRCGIEDTVAGTRVPVDVAVSMPGMRDLSNGAPARDIALVTPQSGITAPRFAPDMYLQQLPSQLRFSASGQALTEMLKAPGSQWRGDITVIFDSEP